MYSRFITLFSLCTFSMLLTGCASVTTGTNQSISVHTEPEKGAICELSNDKGTWYVSSTPGTVTVNRAYGDMNIICKKGEKSNMIKVKSSTKAMNVGNVIFGGFVGLAVDAGTGAGYDYPSIIHVPLN